ncbi:MAG TPA: superoxide dismutase family protein [Candidatus Acidoferrum sp.]|nr:superoxide dismutase family protein [Candidatus Acidoferrum sp.]
MNRLRGAVAAIALLCPGCAGVAVTPLGAVATVELRDAGSQVVGQATLTEVGGGVRIVLEATGLPPGPKGVHLHATGTCERPAFTSAGDHFNPKNAQHGLRNPAGPHAGDLPNITIQDDGKGRLETFTERVSLGGGSASLFDDDGTALVIHAVPDDFTTDPSGNSGARIACGIVEKRAPRP